MGKREDLSDFDKGQIVMARRLGQSISKTAELVGRSRYAVVSTYQKWSKEGQPVNRRQGNGRPRLIDAHGEQRLACLVRSHGRATVAQIAESLNASHDRKVSEHTVHRSLLRMGLRRRKPDRVPMLTPVYRRKHQQWTRERQNCTMEQCKKSEVPKMGKDPKKPRGKVSSYAYFVQSCREEHKKKHPDASINFSEFSKTCSERWKAMSAKEKVKFEDLAKQDKVRYEREMESYVPPKGMKRTKDPSVPKRPPSALFIFCAGHFPKIKSGNPGLSIGDIAKKLGEMWNSTSAEDKQPYEEKAAKLKEKYDKDIAAYHGKGKPAPATVTKAKKSDDEGVHYDEKEGEHYEEEDDDYE